MKNPKILFISGSPRRGNTEFALTQIFDSIKTENKELLLLRDKEIKICRGCSRCNDGLECPIKDDMAMIREKISKADVLVIGSPNYFDNVSGLMKTFIDRCHPFYMPKTLKGKKLFLILVGGERSQMTKMYLNLAFFGFVRYYGLELQNSYAFTADAAGDLKKREGIKEELGRIGQELLMSLRRTKKKKGE